MTTLETAFEVKDEILVLLAKEKDLKHLEQIRAYIADLVIGEGDVDWWDELPSDAQERLLRIRDGMRRGENVVTHTQAKLRLNLGEDSERKDWWDELSAEQQADLDLAMKEIEDPKNLVPDTEARKMLKGWL